MKSKTTFSILLALSTSLLSVSAMSASPSTESTATPATTQQAQVSQSKVVRTYLVRLGGKLTSLTDNELDAPAELTSVGNARKVTYHGANLDVESTLISAGKETLRIDRYAALGEYGDI